MIFNEESTIKEAMAYDAFADRHIDQTYLDRGNYNRPLQNEEINRRLPTREQVKQKLMSFTRNERMTEEEKDKKGPFSILIEDVITALNMTREETPELYELIINQLVAEKQLRDALPKEVDFANFMVFFDSTFGFETWNEEQRKGSVEKNGFINYGVSELLETIDTVTEEQAEIEEIFFDPYKVMATDHKHSQVEQRYVLLGKTYHQRLLYAVFTIREGIIRIISARDVNKKEIYLYEKTT